MKTKSSAAAVVTRWTNPSTASLVLMGLLLPGGAVLLAWMLCRKLLPRARIEALKRVLPVLLVVFLQACATQLDLRADSSPRDANTAGAKASLTFQKYSAAPAGEDVFVGPEALRPGDILLTSMPGFAGAGIELLTIAPVSHAAVYIGDGRVVEAVRSGVGERRIEAVFEEESVALVLRDPDLDEAQAERIKAYALQKTGAGFNFVGVTLQIPFAISRRLCELPLVPSLVRDPCIRGMGVFSKLAARERQFFCSQLVLQAYRHAGAQLTDADPRLVSPADILHMREGDVPSFSIRVPLRYVGHLKYDRPMLAAAAR
ncbi:MAG: distant relative of cell wall-associated hydrolase [Burkholderiales bacterium]